MRTLAFLIAIIMACSIVQAATFIQLNDLNNSIINLSTPSEVQKDSPKGISVKYGRNWQSFLYKSEKQCAEDYARIAERLTMQSYLTCIDNGGGKACNSRR